MAKITIQDLLDAGVHFGHPTKRWNPKMKPYIYGVRNGIYIFDLAVTMRQLQQACQFLYETVAAGGKVLFVGTKRQAKDVVKETAESVGMYHMVERWIGGTLTNNQTIRISIRKLKNYLAMEENGEFDKMPKKEASRYRRELFKLQRDLSGIIKMETLPSAVFVVDVDKERTAIHEANRLKIPVVGVVDTACDPDGVDYVIPANDDALRSIRLILDVCRMAIEAGLNVYQKQVAEQEQAEQINEKIDHVESDEKDIPEKPRGRGPSRSKTPRRKKSMRNEGSPSSEESSSVSNEEVTSDSESKSETSEETQVSSVSTETQNE